MTETNKPKILEDKDEIVKETIKTLPLVLQANVLSGKRKYFIKEVIAMAYRLGVKHGQEK